MSDPIKAALAAAAKAGSRALGIEPDGLYRPAAAVMPETVAAIVAFLRACPVMGDLPPGMDKMCFVDDRARENWAAAVERAAKETGDA